MKMSIESWWNDIEKGKPDYFVYSKFHIDWTGIEPGSIRTLYLDIQFVSHKEHGMLPLERPVGKCCVGKYRSES
jgi:hypothetical protein